MSTRAIPTGFHSVTPNLAVDGGPEAIDFYRRAFGAEVVRRLDAGGKVMYAELRIGDAIVTVNDEMPEFDSKAPDPDRPVPISLTIYCDDGDALYAQASTRARRRCASPRTSSSATASAPCATRSGTSGRSRPTCAT